MSATHAFKRKLCHSPLLINQIDLSPTVLAKAHDDIIIAVEEEERATVKISKQAESPTCTKNRTRELNRDFVLCL